MKLSVMQLSAMLKQHGHKADLLISQGPKDDAISKIKTHDPDIIAFSVLTTEQDWVIRLASGMKPNGIRAFVIAGGHHPTFFPDFVLNDGIDAVNVGEGDHSLLELADTLDQNGDVTVIRNLVVKTQTGIVRNPVRPMADQEALPLPDRDIYLQYPYFHQADFYDFNVSVGCPYNCSYCFFHQWRNLYKGTPGMKVFQLKSVNRCIREIKDLSSRVHIPLVAYVDSTFNLDKAWMLDFLNAYTKEIDIPFTINLRANLVDETIVKALADTGQCRFVRMGIEVGSESLRTGLLRKNVTNAQIYAASDLLKAYGIPLLTYTMYCLPGQTLEEAYETIEMNQRLRPLSTSSLIFHPYPGMDLTRYAMDHGYLLEEDIEKLKEKRYNRMGSILRQKHLREVENLSKLAMIPIRFPATFPLIKRLIKLPPNRLFDLIGMASRLFGIRQAFNSSYPALLKKYVFGRKIKMT